MDPLERKVIRRLVFEPETLSRNKNFHTFNDPTMKRARRTANLLRSILRDARRLGPEHVQIARQDDQVVISIRDTDSELHREAYVSTAELAILTEDDRFVASYGDALREVGALQGA